MIQMQLSSYFCYDDSFDIIVVVKLKKILQMPPFKHQWLFLENHHHLTFFMKLLDDFQVVFLHFRRITDTHRMHEWQ